MKKTWKELSAEGVSRCCATFKGGGRCRRRSVEAYGWSWCEKHGPTMEGWSTWSAKVVKDERDGTNTAGGPPARL